MKFRYNSQEVELRFSHVLEYAALHVISFVFRLFPLSWELAWAGPIGRFLYGLDRKHRERAVDNLGRAYPEKSAPEIDRTAREVFVSLVKMVFEFIHISSMSTIPYIEKNVRLVNWELLDRLLEKGKGIVVITSHLGNWELEGAVASALGHSLNALYFQQSNFLADHFFNSIRRKAGISLIYKRNAFRHVLQALSRNEIVAFLSDQDAKRDGLFVDFFGRPASTPKGPVYFGLKTGAPVVLAWFVREPSGGYTMGVEEVPLTVTGDLQADLQSNTEAWMKKLEEIIRRYPEQWFWVHRRWKTKPTDRQEKQERTGTAG